MSRAQQRRIKSRCNKLARLAFSNPSDFDAALRERMESWAARVRKRANNLRGQSAHQLADQVSIEMRELAALAPETLPVAAEVADAIRQTATTEIARAVDPRMARLSNLPIEGK